MSLINNKLIDWLVAHSENLFARVHDAMLDDVGFEFFFFCISRQIFRNLWKNSVIMQVSFLILSRG